MNKKRRRRSMLRIVIISLVIALVLLTVGPLIINYIFITEEVHLNMNLAFDAGNLLDYYGAILGGLVTCFAIISAVHINNLNIKEDRQHEQFEKAYEIYHKLPDMLAKLESAAIHLQYSVHISEATLMETLDTMEECDNVLREQHFMNEKYYNKTIDSLLKNITDASEKCQKTAEQFLTKVENATDDTEPPHEELESAFTDLRTAIQNAKNEITSEINKFVFNNDD